MFFVINQLEFGTAPAFKSGEGGKQMKKALLAMMILAGSAVAGPRITVGIGFGAPAPVAVVRPVCPGPGYFWVDGYYGPAGVWVPGFWRAPVVGVGPRFVAPRYVAPPFVAYEHGHEFRRGFRR
jgi:hypothetical protein